MDVDGSEVEVGVGVEVKVGVASDNGVDDVKREKNEVKKRMRWVVFRRAAIIYRQSRPTCGVSQTRTASN